MDAVRFAIDEVNATNAVPRIELTVHDDGSTEQGARDTARQIVAEDALAVIGPSLTTSSLAAGPVYAEQGMISVVPTAHGNAIINSGTTFRTVFSTGEIGEALANYLHHVLHGRKAVVVYRNNGYGKPLADGFRRNADRYGLEAQFSRSRTKPSAMPPRNRRSRRPTIQRSCSPRPSRMRCRSSLRCAGTRSGMRSSAPRPWRARRICRSVQERTGSAR